MGPSRVEAAGLSSGSKTAVQKAPDPEDKAVGGMGRHDQVAGEDPFRQTLCLPA